MNKWKSFINEVSQKSSTVASVVCVNSDNKILVIKRSKEEDSHKEHWDLPGGHIDHEDNSIEQGAIRELEEETGLKASQNSLFYLQKMAIGSIDKYYYGLTEWSGVVQFTKNPESGIIEHTDYKWASVDDLKANKTFELRTFPTYLLDKAIAKVNFSK